MTQKVAWKRLVRYRGDDSQIRYGEPQLKNQNDDIRVEHVVGRLEVEILEGDDVFSAKPSGKFEQVKELLSPLTSADVPYLRCIGLNYKTHILETGRPLPTVPTIFTKPGTSITGPSNPILIPHFAQDQCDYEGELTIVIGKDGKNLNEEEALDYVAGYTVCNDVSARDWQRDPNKAGPVPQWSYSKSFDDWAPIGPMLVSTEVVGDASGLDLRTYVNGEMRQESNTSDLCFGVRALVKFCSQGQTLQKGSLIVTGTPGGVGLFMKPQVFLKDGDEVSVKIGQLGSIANRMVFEKSPELR